MKVLKMSFILMMTFNGISLDRITNPLPRFMLNYYVFIKLFGTLCL